MKGTIRIHVAGAGKGNRVSMYIYQTLASGMTPTEYTNEQGDAYIPLDTDAYAQAEIYVNGKKVTERETIEDTYYVNAP